jgi:hypothetical protein
MTIMARARLSPLGAAALLTLGALAAPGAAQQKEPEKRPPPITPLPARARLPAQAPNLPAVVRLRLPIAGGAPAPAALRELSPPPPLTPDELGALAEAAGAPRPAPVRAAPVRAETVRRPAEFILSAHQPYLINAGYVVLDGVWSYQPDSPRDFNEGRGWVALGENARIELHFYAEAGARYLLDFSLQQMLRAPYRLTAGGRASTVSFDDLSHHLVVLSEPAESSGWSTVSLSAEMPEGSDDLRYLPQLPGLTPDDYMQLGLWTFFGATVSRLER